MLKELFDAIAAKALVASAPQIANWNPELDIAFKTPDGAVTFRDGEPKRRNHNVASVDDIAQFARDHSESNSPASCWYDSTGAILLTDDAVRKERVTMALRPSPAFARLADLSKPNAGLITQANLIWELRTIFKYAISDSAGLVALVRSVKWNQTSDSENIVNRGKSSLGKSIQKELTATGVLPEYIIFNVPVWDANVIYNVNVECVFDPDEQNGCFKLMPLQGQIESAIAQAREELGRRLANALDGIDPAVLLYNGAP